MTSERRPSFSRSFPRVPELDALVDAFARGDYRRARAEARKLERLSEDAAVRQAARTLIERTNPDALALTLLALAALLFIVMTGWWIAHGKPPPVNGPPLERVR
jgi:hypothetical protein